MTRAQLNFFEMAKSHEPSIYLPLDREVEQWPVVHPYALAIESATILDQVTQCTSETTSPGPRVTVLSADSSAGAEFPYHPVRVR